MTTTYQPVRAKMSAPFVALAIISLALASFGYFELFAQFGGMPVWLAAVSVGGLDIAAIALGKHALTVAQDGDSAAPWNLAFLLLVGLGSFAQLSYSILAGHPIAVGIVSMAFPIVTALLFEGQLRRVFRLNGRAAGRVAPPRATVDMLTWLLYRRLAMRATKLAVLDRDLDTDSALVIAERQLAIEQDNANAPKSRRTIRRTYAAVTSNGEVVDLTPRTQIEPTGPVLHVPARIDRTTSDSAPDDRTSASDNPDDGNDTGSDNTEQSTADVRKRGELTRAVNAAAEIVGTSEFEKALRIVRLSVPDADPESVRRILNRRRTG